MPNAETWCRAMLLDFLTKRRVLVPGDYHRIAAYYRGKGPYWLHHPAKVIRFSGPSAPYIDRRLRRYAQQLGFTSYPQFVHHVICWSLDHN